MKTSASKEINKIVALTKLEGTTKIVFHQQGVFLHYRFVYYIHSVCLCVGEVYRSLIFKSINLG